MSSNKSIQMLKKIIQLAIFIISPLASFILLQTTTCWSFCSVAGGVKITKILVNRYTFILRNVYLFLQNRDS